MHKQIYLQDRHKQQSFTEEMLAKIEEKILL